MTDVIVNANRESALLTSMEKANVSDLYSYRLLANAPNGSRSILSVSPQIAPSANPASQSMTFRIPRYGKLQRMLIQSTFAATGADNNGVDETDLGLRVFSDISLRAHSKLIASTNQDYNTVRKLDADKEMSDAIVDIANDTSFTSDAEVTVYTPVPMWFQEKTSNYLDLQFVEQLELDCTVNTTAGMGLDSDITSSSFKLFCFYRHLAPDAQRAYEAKNFSPQSPLNMLIYDQYTETATGTASPSTIDLKVPHAVFATHIFFRTTAKDVGPSLEPQTITVNMTGRPIFNAVPGDVLTYDGSFFHKGNSGRSAAGVHTYNTGTKKALTIYWGESKDRTYQSHSVAAANINNFQISATTSSSAANYTLVVVHEYWKICTVNPDDGRIDIGFSL